MEPIINEKSLIEDSIEGVESLLERELTNDEVIVVHEHLDILLESMFQSQSIVLHDICRGFKNDN